MSFFERRLRKLRKSSSDHPLPSFKTRTIWYDSFKLKFGIHSHDLISRKPLKVLPEFGTSTSLDGCYLDRPVFPPGVTLAFPLNRHDLPKFYLNPYGQYRLYRPNCIIDSPTFIHEVEVKYPRKLFQKDILWVVIHRSEKDIKQDFEKRAKELKKEMEKGGMTAVYSKEILMDYEIYYESAKEFIQYLRKRFKVIPKVPITPFRTLVRKIAPTVYETYHKIVLTKNTMERYKIIEELARPLHLAIAEAYGIDYEKVKEETVRHIKIMRRR